MSRVMLASMICVIAAVDCGQTPGARDYWWPTGAGGGAAGGRATGLGAGTGALIGGAGDAGAGALPGH